MKNWETLEQFRFSYFIIKTMKDIELTNHSYFTLLSIHNTIIHEDGWTIHAWVRRAVSLSVLKSRVFRFGYLDLSGLVLKWIPRINLLGRFKHLLVITIKTSHIVKTNKCDVLNHFENNLGTMIWIKNTLTC